MYCLRAFPVALVVGIGPFFAPGTTATAPWSGPWPEVAPAVEETDPNACDLAVRAPDEHAQQFLREGVVKPTAKNTFVFNHVHLRSEPVDRPYVLEVGDGEYFQVLFKCTAPEFFNYTITGDSSAQPDNSSATTFPEFISVASRLTTRGVTMRHDSRFLKYRVLAKVRPGILQPQAGGAAPPGAEAPGSRGTRGVAGPPVAAGPVIQGQAEGTAQNLYSVEFDIWVVTAPEWRLGVVAGVAISSLTDPKYYVQTDATGAKTFQEDSNGDSWHTDALALANVYYSRPLWRTFNPGLAFGIGTSGTTPRFFIGPSAVFGRFFVLTAGWAIGSIAAPPVGQQIGKPPVNGDNTLNSLSSRVVTRRYLGIGFTWIDRRDQFAASLAATASASGTVGSCVTSVTPDTLTFETTGPEGEKTVTVEAGNDCLWVASVQNEPTAFDVAGGRAKGKGEIKVSVLSEPTPEGRTDVLNVVGPQGSAPKVVRLIQGPKSCVTSVNGGEALSFEGKTEVQPVAIIASPRCHWTAELVPADKFSFRGEAEGTGSGSVKITPPAPGPNQAEAVLKVTGPTGANAVQVKVTQPAKSPK